MLISVIFVLLLYENTSKEISLFSYFLDFIWEIYLKLKICFRLEKQILLMWSTRRPHLLCLFIKILHLKLFSILELPMNFFYYYEHEFFREHKFFKYLFLELIFFSHLVFYSQKTLENINFGNSFNQKV